MPGITAVVPSVVPLDASTLGIPRTLFRPSDQCQVLPAHTFAAWHTAYTQNPELWFHMLCIASTPSGCILHVCGSLLAPAND